MWIKCKYIIYVLNNTENNTTEELLRVVMHLLIKYLHCPSCIAVWYFRVTHNMSCALTYTVLNRATSRKKTSLSHYIIIKTLIYFYWTVIRSYFMIVSSHIQSIPFWLLPIHSIGNMLIRWVYETISQQ